MTSAEASGFRIRRRVLSAIDHPPAVLETHAADAFYFDRVWHRARSGFALAPDAEGAAILARYRPAWSVYEADATKAIRAGLARGRAFDVVDVDAPKQSLPMLDALFVADRAFPASWHLVVRDRAREAAPKLTGAQHARLAQILARYGGGLRAQYAAALLECITYLAESIGYTVTHWESAYCAKRDSVVDLWARLEKT